MIQTFKQPDVTYRNIASLKNLQAEEVHANVLFVISIPVRYSESPLFQT